MKRNCISDNFTFWNAKEWSCNSLPVNNCTPNYAWVLSCNTGMITHIIITFLLVILKNRTYLSRPSLGIFERDVHSLISFSLRQIKPSMSASECQCCSDRAVSWNLLGSISSAYGVVMRLLLGSAIVDTGVARSVLFVGSVLVVYGVAAVWVSFKSQAVFVFPDSCVYCQ